MAILLLESLYRVEQKSWCPVARKFLPNHSQPRPAMPGWCLAKQLFFQHNTLYSFCRFWWHLCLQNFCWWDSHRCDRPNQQAFAQPCTCPPNGFLHSHEGSPRPRPLEEGGTSRRPHLLIIRGFLPFPVLIGNPYRHAKLRRTQVGILSILFVQW